MIDDSPQGSSRKQRTRSNAVLEVRRGVRPTVRTAEHGSVERKQDGRLESSPCNLWQIEQEALSNVSVHSQKAAAELQATARWLYWESQREQRSTAKGKWGSHRGS